MGYFMGNYYYIFFYPLSEMPESVIYKQGKFALFLNAGKIT